MIFDRKQNLDKASDIIKAVLVNPANENQEFAIQILNKKGRKTVDTGTLYFKGTKLYAVDVESYTFPVYTRVKTSGLVRESDLQMALQVSGGDPNSNDFLAQLLTQGSLPEKTTDAFTKEHYLEQLAIILSWTTCQGKMLHRASTTSFTLPMIEFKAVYDIIRGRQRQRNEFLGEINAFLKDDEFPLICPEKAPGTQINDKFPLEIKSILALSDGNHTFTDIANETGIGLDIVIQTIHKLWTHGILWLSYNAIQLSYSSVKKYQEARKLGTPVDDIEQYTMLDIEKHQQKPQNNEPEPEPSITDEALGDTQSYQDNSQLSPAEISSSSAPLEEAEEEDSDLIVISEAPDDDNSSQAAEPEHSLDEEIEKPTDEVSPDTSLMQQLLLIKQLQSKLGDDMDGNVDFENFMETSVDNVPSDSVEDVQTYVIQHPPISESHNEEEAFTYQEEDSYDIPKYSEADMNEALAEFGKKAQIVEIEEIESSTEPSTEEVFNEEVDTKEDASIFAADESTVEENVDDESTSISEDITEEAKSEDAESSVNDDNPPTMQEEKTEDTMTNEDVELQDEQQSQVIETVVSNDTDTHQEIYVEPDVVTESDSPAEKMVSEGSPEPIEEDNTEEGQEQDVEQDSPKEESSTLDDSDNLEETLDSTETEEADDRVEDDKDEYHSTAITVLTNEQIDAMDMNALVSALNVSKAELDTISSSFSSADESNAEIESLKSEIDQDEKALTDKRDQCLKLYGDYITLQESYEKSKAEFEEKLRSLESKIDFVQENTLQNQQNEKDKALAEDQIVKLSQKIVGLLLR